MFIGGFFFLPWLWLCNFIYVREYLSKSNTPPAVKTYGWLSFGGFVIYTILFAIWLTIYLVKRNDWGTTGDQISLLIPNGDQ